MALADLYPKLHFIVQMNKPAANGHLSRPSTSSRRSLSSAGFWSSGSHSNDIRQQQLSSRLTVQQRASGTLQTIQDAAVYILYLPPASPAVPSSSILAGIAAELKAHISVLRANSSATLVLAAYLLPEPGKLDADVEVLARLRNLSLMQLANEREIEESEVISMLNGVEDRMGRLTVVNKLLSRNNATVAFEIRYQTYANRDEVVPAPESA